MATWETVQDNFSEGALSPRYLGQVAADRVRNGLLEAVNAICFPQGAVAKRPGTMLTGSYEATVFGAQSRVWSFIGPNNQDLVAFFTAESVEILDPVTGVILGSLNPFIPQPETLIDAVYSYSGTVDNINYTAQSGGFTGTSTLAALAASAKSLTVGYGFQTPRATVKIDGFSAFEEFVFRVGINWRGQGGRKPELDYSFRIALESAPGAGDFAQLVVSPPIEWVDFNYQIEALLPGGFSPTGELYATIELALGVNADFVLPLGHGVIATIFGFEVLARPDTPPTPITFTTPYSNAETAQLHFLQSPFDDRELIILHPNHYPRALYFDASLSAWDFDLYSFTTDPPEWDTDNYPGIGAAVQGRLVLGGVPSHPEKFWFSEVYDWADIYSASPPTSKADPLEFIAQERDVNTWILSGKAVLYGDRRAEREIFSSGEVIAGDDVAVRTQTHYGAERMPQKILMGKYAVLATGGRSELRLMHYAREDFGYISPNIALKAEHLARRRFRRHFVTRRPHLMLWGIMDDGTITVCSFDDELQINAWSLFQSPTGQYIDGCRAIGADGSDLALVTVRRFIGGVEQIHVETFNPLGDIDSWQPLDASIRVFLPSPQDGMIAGFDLLEGLEVAVFLDGQYDGNQIVEGGEVYARDPAQQILVGLPFDFRIKTMPQASITPAVGLASQKRFSKVGVRGLLSLPPIINGQRPPDRSAPSPMGEMEVADQFFDVDVSDANFDTFGIVTVEEPLPVRLTIAAIYGKLKSN